MKLNPFIKPKFNGTKTVMFDVVIALLPLIFTAWLAYGISALKIIGISIVTALATEFLFSLILFKKLKSIFDFSALITALLLAFTLSPMTPWYIVAFGAFAALLFGKILWGGLGKNRFNPALVGREFMAAFFVSAMTSSSIWKTKSVINVSTENLFPNLKYDNVSQYLSELIYKSSGALGETSILFLILGGIYLILRNRISWHIPVFLILGFLILLWIFGGNNQIHFSLAGLLLGGIFMATDMPSSPTTKDGKIYYGLMIGITAFIFILGKIQFEYLSYSILLLNGFSNKISNVFKPRVWGTKTNWKQKGEAIFVLTLSILAVCLAMISLYYYELINYLVYVYIIYLIFKYTTSFHEKISNPI